MNILFIRHAKTENHENNRRQYPDSKLGEFGKKQAKVLGKHLKKKITNKEYEHILTSSFNRALETANIVASEVGLEVLENELIHEILAHPDLDGKSFDSEIALRFIKEVEKYGHNLDWKFDGGGESLREVASRAINFKNHLINNYKEKNVIVVTHGTFLRTFLTITLLGDEYEDKAFKRTLESFKVENTSITQLKYDEVQEKWYLYTLNSTEHFKKLSLPLKTNSE